MTTPFYFASNDVMFKRIFGDERNTEHLVSLLRAVLDLPPEDYAEVRVINPFLAREHPDDKLGILDIKVKTPTGKIIDIEIQLCEHEAMRERVVFYLAKMVTDQIGASCDYWNIKRSICIFIMDFELVPENGLFHNQYVLRDRAGAQFTDLMEVVTLELPKLPEDADGTALWDWMKFIGTRDREVLEMLATKNLEVRRAADMLADLNSDERARMEAESREKLRRDIAHYKLDAERKGMAKGMAKGLAEGRLSIARNLLKLGRPVDEVAAATLLSKEEVQSLTHPQMDQATPGKSGGEPDSRIKP